jgi:hypothetical protein
MGEAVSQNRYMLADAALRIILRGQSTFIFHNTNYFVSGKDYGHWLIEARIQLLCVTETGKDGAK